MPSDTENTRILQTHSHTNPVQESRCRTNTPFIFVFALIVLLWFAVGIQAFVRGSTSQFDNERTDYKDDYLFVLFRCVNITLPYLSPPIETFDKVFIFSLFFGGISVFNCIVLIKTFTRPYVYISLLMFSILLVIQFGSIVTLALNLVINIFDIFTLAYLSVCVVYAITVLFCVHNVGLQTLCTIVKNSTRAIIDCPTTLLFTLVIVILEILVVVFALNTLKIILSSNDSIFWIIGFALVMTFGGVVIGAFIILFGMAVISEYTVNWFWSADKKEISFRFITQSIVRIASNHFGTIALESTLIIPLFYAAVRAIKYRNKSGRQRNCWDIFIDSVAKATLVCSIVHSALIHTSIYGSNYVKATKKTMRLVVSNASLYLATIEIYNMIAVIGLIGNTIVMFFTAYVMVRIKHIPVHNMPLPFFWGFYIPVAVYSILMISVGRALSMNRMIMLSTEKDLQEGPVVV